VETEKLGVVNGLNVNVAVVVWVVDPVPVMWTVYVPAVEDLHVKVEVPVFVKLVGVRVQVTAEGKGVSVIVTVPVKPFW